MIRRLLITVLAAAAVVPAATADILPQVPSAHQILRQLEANPSMRIGPEARVSVRAFKSRPDLRAAAPSIDIQAINFAFGAADIPHSQHGKVAGIADALHEMLDRRPHARILIEGHTDAVGPDHANLALSQQRAASLKRLLVREFGVPAHALETVGYGEDYLVVATPYESWENRRVTLRRFDDFIR